MRTFLLFATFASCLAETEVAVFDYSTETYTPSTVTACLGAEIDLTWSTPHIHTLYKHSDATCTTAFGASIESGSTATAGIGSPSAGSHFYASAEKCAEGARVQVDVSVDYCDLAD